MKLEKLKVDKSTFYTYVYADNRRLFPLYTESTDCHPHYKEVFFYSLHCNRHQSFSILIPYYFFN